VKGEKKGWREKNRRRRRRREKLKNKISMDHRLRCAGTIPKLSFHLLLSLLLFTFAHAAFDLATIPFNDGYSPLFGDSNVVRSADGNGVQLLLDRFTGKSFTYTSSCATTTSTFHVLFLFMLFLLCAFFLNIFIP